MVPGYRWYPYSYNVACLPVARACGGVRVAAVERWDMGRALKGRAGEGKKKKDTFTFPAFSGQRERERETDEREEGHVRLRQSGKRWEEVGRVPDPDTVPDWYCQTAVTVSVFFLHH